MKEINKSFYIGIQTNNLKNIDFAFEHGIVVFISGPSGSGKSSLAIDTIHKISEDELNQLKNLKDSVSEYVINEYRNILPSICIQQENYNVNPRSTIATYFNLDKYFREIFSVKHSISQQLFQFNVAESACAFCSGTGISFYPDKYKIIDHNLRIADVPFKNWKNQLKPYYQELLLEFCNEKSIDSQKKFTELNESQQELILNGISENKIKVTFKSNNRIRRKTGCYKGPLYELRNEFQEKKTSKSKFKYFSETTCPHCKGFRFSNYINSLLFFEKSIGEIYSMEISDLYEWIGKISKTNKLTELETKNLRSFVNFTEKIIALDLGYLNLNRSIPSLSGGELQRLIIAKSLNMSFSNIMFVLDEPTSGLHPIEWEKIGNAIIELKKRKNTILIIEHNEYLKNVSDKKIFLGPKGGIGGGFIIKDNKIKNPPLEKKFFSAKGYLQINNFSVNNIKNINEKIPLGTIVGVCGKSGSGKTSFIKEVIPVVAEKSIYIKQEPIRGNQYSIAATALGIMPFIQQLFSKHSRLSKDYFTFSSTGKGQCQSCNGTGVFQEESVFYRSNITCPECNGKRFSRATLKYKYNGYNIYEFLQRSVSDLVLDKDNNLYPIKNLLEYVKNFGLEYINLFQKTSSFSGGESQRIKLINSIFNNKSCKIFLLDEPFRGIDRENIDVIFKCLYDLVLKGFTFYIAEHNPYALQYCSYFIEFGPGGGKNGGKITSSGIKEDFISALSYPFIFRKNSEIYNPK